MMKVSGGNMRFLKKSRWILAALLILGLAGTSFARNVNIEQNMGFQKPNDVINSNYNILDVNNQTTWVGQDGFFSWNWDHYAAANAIFPKGTLGVLFSQGILWGARVNDGGSVPIRVNGSDYSNGLRTGKVLYNTTDDPASGVKGPDTTGARADYHVWRVNVNWDQDINSPFYDNAATQFYGGTPTAAQKQNLKDSYESDWNNWPADLGAPYEDVDGNGSYDPAVDIPGYPGATQTMWFVANDLYPGASASTYASPPIGIEMQMTLWGYGFSASSPLGNISFKKVRLIYTGLPGGPDTATMDSLFVTQWADPDVGDAGDDFAGSDTTLSLGYAYNGNNQDGSYLNTFGLAPPAVGFDFLQGPIFQGDTLGMTSYGYFAAGSAVSDPDLGEYNGTLQWYNLMRGYKPRPEYPDFDPWVDPITGDNTKFVLTGDPVTGSGWIDGIQLPPGDRRILQNTGPFSMAVGDTQDIVVGQIAALGNSNTSSVSKLRYYDTYAQYAYDQGFQLPTPPAAPSVNVTELDQKVVLNWGFNKEAVAATEEPVSNGFKFQGYNVYQLPSASSNINDGIKVATFDKADLVGTVLDNVYNDETGFVTEAPVQTGTNNGIQRFYVASTDAVRGRPLANGVTYYFAVTSYSYLAENEGAPFKTLESGANILAVTPQPMKPGTTEPVTPESHFEITHQGGSTADVRAIAVDPEQMKSANYEVQFEYFNPIDSTTSDQLAAGDTTADGEPFPLRWNLFRGNTMLGPEYWIPQMPEGTPPSTAPIYDGVQVVVPHVAPGFATWDYTGTRWITGVNWGGAQFFNGADIGANFFGSTLTIDQLETVVMKFQGDTTSGPADGWASKGAEYLRPSYSYEGSGYLPFAAYAVDAAGNERQVNVTFLEDAGAGNFNHRWDLGGWDGSAYKDPATGGREYVFINKTDYDEGATYDGSNDGTVQDVMYAMWATQRGDHPYLEAPFEMTFVAAIANSPNDVFSFTSTAVDSGVTDSLEASISDINVFPNPYYGFSRLENSRFNKFVTFTHLPEKATIRIFNLGGVMVRKIDHNSTSQFERWDLTNQDDLPVASGIYIVHVETDQGSKVLKLALVQEEQVLRSY